MDRFLDPDLASDFGHHWGDEAACNLPILGWQSTAQLVGFDGAHLVYRDVADVRSGLAVGRVFA